MGKIVLLAVVFLLLIPVAVLCQVTYEPKSKLLSVKAEGKLLTEVLSDVSAKTGMEVYINPASDRKIFVDIRRQPVEKALREMVKPLNNAFIYKGKAIKAVKIFDKSEGEATARVLPGATPSRSGAADLKTPPTRDDVLKRLQERRRQIAISQGRLKEFEAKEAAQDKRMKEREQRRLERFKEREKMRAERMATIRARVKEGGQAPQQAPQGQPTERAPRRNLNLERPPKQ